MTLKTAEDLAIDLHKVHKEINELGPKAYTAFYAGDEAALRSLFDKRLELEAQADALIKQLTGHDPVE